MSKATSVLFGIENEFDVVSAGKARSMPRNFFPLKTGRDDSFGRMEPLPEGQAARVSPLGPLAAGACRRA